MRECYFYALMSSQFSLEALVFLGVEIIGLLCFWLKPIDPDDYTEQGVVNIM